MADTVAVGFAVFTLILSPKRASEKEIPCVSCLATERTAFKKKKNNNRRFPLQLVLPFLLFFILF